MADPTTLVAGETLVDFIPDHPGPLADVESFSPRPGGAPANVAVAMARLDAPPFFLTRIATDDFGDLLASRLAAEDVPDDYVQRDPDRQTTLAFVTHDETADRSFSFYRENAADAYVTASTVPDSVLETVDRLAIGGVVLTAEPGRTEFFDLVDRANEHDCTVAFDPNIRPELWSDQSNPAAVVESMVERVDVVKTATDDFAAFDYPSAPDQLAERLLDRGPHTVVLTMGSAGATLYADEGAPWGRGTWSHAGFDVDPVDTTGAGDGFLGGFLAALDESGDSNDADPAGLLSFANAVAALTTTGDGAWTALPDRDAVDALREGSE